MLTHKQIPEDLIAKVRIHVTAISCHISFLVTAILYLGILKYNTICQDMAVMWNMICQEIAATRILVFAIESWLNVELSPDW